MLRRAQWHDGHAHPQDDRASHALPAGGDSLDVAATASTIELSLMLTCSMSNRQSRPPTCHGLGLRHVSLSASDPSRPRPSSDHGPASDQPRSRLWTSHDLGPPTQLASALKLSREGLQPIGQGLRPVALFAIIPSWVGLLPAQVSTSDLSRLRPPTRRGPGFQAVERLLGSL